MSGFDNDVVYAKNADFTQADNQSVSESNGLATDGQLWIGRTAVNAGSTHISVGTITSPLGTLSIGYLAPNITMDLVGGITAVEHLTGDTGGQLNPTANNFNLLSTVVVAGTTPIVIAGVGSTLTTKIQRSAAIASTDATKVGLCNFSSASFAVDANGFVTAAGSLATTYTGDSGASPAVPAAGNLNIVGLAGSQTSTSGSTVTIKSPPFVQIGSSATSAKNTGEFVTAAVTRTLPASAGLIDGDLFIYVCTSASALVIQSVTAQKIRLGASITAAAGTATSTAIGDSITLRFNATDGFFYAVSSIGSWTLV